MSLPQFNDVKVLSNTEISDAIIQAEKDLFNLRFKKATRQPFKSHEIKHTKRRLAQLKTVLTLRLDALEQKNPNAVVNLMKNQNYMTGNF
jgi:large subunit ribosomal protein L29|uniref:Large ribosomal subunit protein uL29c n=1 Tax=Eucampia zodiacus TaxID=444606 RepID=A0A898CUJ5_9STRA|nr:ribosomal protein L29 [Eucampia zodiacus]QSH90578.1 ribosomal protein L29 [Eucampia zodiacus]